MLDWELNDFIAYSEPEFNKGQSGVTRLINWKNLFWRLNMTKAFCSQSTAYCILKVNYCTCKVWLYCIWLYLAIPSSNDGQENAQEEEEVCWCWSGGIRLRPHVTWWSNECSFVKARWKVLHGTNQVLALFQPVVSRADWRPVGRNERRGHPLVIDLLQSRVQPMFEPFHRETKQFIWNSPNSARFARNP